MRSTSTETTLPNPTVKDRLAIHQTILRLTAFYKTIVAAVVVVVAVIWLTLIKRILYFGRTLDYSGLEALGIDAVLIKQYTPFFWWTVVVIFSLILSHFLFRFVQYTRQRASQKIITDKDLQNLLKTISPAATHVLAWSWENRRHPITVGVLQQTTSQLGANRYSLICLAKDQELQVEKHLTTVQASAEPLHHL